MSAQRAGEFSGIMLVAMSSVPDLLERELKKLDVTAPHFHALLGDPLSSLSRERQKWLLVLSGVCILLSRKILILEEVSGFGFKFKSGAQDLLSPLMATVCLCALIAFAASVYQDLVTFAIRVQPNRAELARFALLLNKESNSATHRATEALNRLNSIKEELIALLAIDQPNDVQLKRITVLAGLSSVAAEDVRAASTNLDSALNRILEGPTMTTQVGRVRLFVEVASPILLGGAAAWLGYVQG